MVDLRLKVEKPNVSRAWFSAGTMGFAYFFGMSLFYIAALADLQVAFFQ